MLFVIQQLCPWCLAVHIANTLFFLLAGGYAQVVWNQRHSARAAAGMPPLSILPLAVGACCGLLLAGWQLLFLANFHDPESLVEKLSEVQMGQLPLDAPGEPRPILWTSHGSREAPDQVVVFVCFTCPHCKDAHEVFERILAAHPGKLRVDLRLNPLWPECNPRFGEAKPPPKHRFACGLARLALALTLVDEQAFPAFAHWLYENQEQMTLFRAEQEARQRVDSAKLDAALQSPLVEARLKHDLDLGNRLNLQLIPQVYIPRTQRRLSGQFTRLRMEGILHDELGWPAQ